MVIQFPPQVYDMADSTLVLCMITPPQSLASGPPSARKKKQKTLLYSAKLSREKIFTNFAVLEPATKVFSMKLGVPYPPMIGFSIPQKFSPRNGHFLPIRESFLPRKFPVIYTVLLLYVHVLLYS